MLKPNEDKIQANTAPNYSDDSVRIKAGSFIIDNKWINFNGTVYKVSDYIKSVVVGSRTRFFRDRGYAVYLLVGIDPINGVSTVEGEHVPFTTIKSVPPPDTFSFLPLVGIVLIQDGTRDLNYGFIPLKSDNIQFFSGYGNIIDKDIKGSRGETSEVYGSTGIYGSTGLVGETGIRGRTGITGAIGPLTDPPRGVTGLGGITGISWGINIPFIQFF